MNAIDENHHRNSRLRRRPDVFHYSRYWGTWSRVLTPYSDSPVVELNLTPINSWANEVEPIIFRSHRTSLDQRDQLREELPTEVKFSIIQQIGIDLLTRLVSTDWLPLLDMAKVHRGRHGGGGLPFAECAAVACTECKPCDCACHTPGGSVIMEFVACCEECPHCKQWRRVPADPKRSRFPTIYNGGIRT